MVNRLSGMVSGMDVDSLVKQMITAKRIPLDKINQQKETLQWQRDNYREINSKLFDFRNSKLLKYNNTAQMNTKAVVVSGNTSALKAESTADANGIPMKVEITQLAKPASVESVSVLPKKASDGSKVTSQSKLSALTGGSPTAGKYNIQINGNSFTFDEGMSIANVVLEINKKTETNVTATFDEVTGKFSIASRTYGVEGKAIINTDTNNFLALFGTSKSTVFEQANVKINSQEISFDSNNFLLNGVKFTLLSTTEGNPASVTTQLDSTKALETITSFVKDYNELLSTLQSKISEERYKNYTPLTDEQKQAMTDNDIEMWEKKAKSGLLKNDEILKSTITSMRAELTKNLGDLSSFGITTGQYFENGKLYINEDKLKKSLVDNPQKITTLFQGTTGSDGLFTKLSKHMDTALDKFVIKAGTSKFSSDLTIAYKKDSLIGKQLIDYNTRITTLQIRLRDMESNYYKKFTAMETAMSKYQSQSSSLTSFFS